MEGTILDRSNWENGLETFTNKYNLLLRRVLEWLISTEKLECLWRSRRTGMRLVKQHSRRHKLLRHDHRYRSALFIVFRPNGRATENK